jgi:hypothetical protein
MMIGRSFTKNFESIDQSCHPEQQAILQLELSVVGHLRGRRCRLWPQGAWNFEQRAELVWVLVLILDAGYMYSLRDTLL